MYLFLYVYLQLGLFIYEFYHVCSHTQLAVWNLNLMNNHLCND